MALQLSFPRRASYGCSLPPTLLREKSLWEVVVYEAICYPPAPRSLCPLDKESG